MKAVSRIKMTYVQAALDAGTVSLEGVVDSAGNSDDGGDDGDCGETHFVDMSLCVGRRGVDGVR